MTTLAVETIDATLAVSAPVPTQLIATTDPPLVLEVSPIAATLAVEVVRAAVLTAPAERGPAGVPGPPADDLLFVATTGLSGHRAVYVQPDGALAYASADNLNSLDAFVGVTLGATAASAPVIVRASGEINEPSWSWTPGPVWLGLDGQLTQVDPGVATALFIGVALAATRLFVMPEPAIRPA